MKYRLLFGIFSALVLILLITNCCNDNEEPRKGKSNAIFNPDKTYGSVKDIDGNEYKTITIGTQTWMAENLRTTHYCNGDPIPNITDNTQWGMQTSGAYCNYKNTIDLDSIAIFGRLYNWYTTIDILCIAPNGWHVPTDEEWETLVRYLSVGDSSLAVGTSGGKLMEASTLHWGRANRASNSSGFTALPGGYRDSGIVPFLFNGYLGLYWSASEHNGLVPLNRSMCSDFLGISRNGGFKTMGMSIRCVKD
jgi:uncharacterized protein (TIGR02145 family)